MRREFLQKEFGVILVQGQVEAAVEACRHLPDLSLPVQFLRKTVQKSGNHDEFTVRFSDQVSRFNHAGTAEPAHKLHP